MMTPEADGGSLGFNRDGDDRRGLHEYLPQSVFHIEEYVTIGNV
jgi:hypothetical protein